jgi:hypothetical protein
VVNLDRFYCTSVLFNNAVSVSRLPYSVESYDDSHKWIEKDVEVSGHVWLEVCSYHSDIFLELLKKTAKATSLVASFSIFEPVSFLIGVSSVPA